MFAVGPLAGTLYPGNGRLTVTAKSPLTDIFGSTNIGGFFGAEMKYAGYDQIVIFGKAEKPVYLWIDDDQVEQRDAAHLWGKSTWETGLRIKEELGDPGVEVMAIGPGGENLVRFACIINPPKGAAGRTGMGAVMGSKNLKAIAIRGTKGVRVAEPDEFFRVCRESTVFGRTEPGYEALRRGGSPHWMDFLAPIGTAAEGLKATFVIFFLPFLYIYTPAIILQLNGLSLTDIVIHFAIVLTFILAMSPLFSNYCLARLGFPEKGLFLIGGVFPLLSIVFPAQSWLLLIIGVISCIGGYGLSFRRSKTVQ